MSSEQVQVEARTLGHEHVGRMLAGATVWPAKIKGVENPDADYPDRVAVALQCPWLSRRRSRVSVLLLPADLVTLTGGGAS